MSHLVLIALMQLVAGDAAPATAASAPTTVTEPAPATQPAPAAEPAPAAPAAASEQRRPQRVCSQVQSTNSRLSRRACYRPISPEEVAQRQENAQNWMRDMQGPQNDITPPNGGR